MAPGAALQPIATQGRSHIDRRMQDLCGSGLQPFFTLNQAAYYAGKNSRVSTVATINPPMIATAIGP